MARLRNQPLNYSMLRRAHPPSPSACYGMMAMADKSAEAFRRLTVEGEGGWWS
jgi:hypothetical protein